MSTDDCFWDQTIRNNQHLPARTIRFGSAGPSAMGGIDDGIVS